MEFFRKLILLLPVLLGFSRLCAQDRLLKTDGSMLKGKVLGTPGAKVKFVEQGMAKEFFKLIPAENIREIYYESGKRVYFNTSVKAFIPTKPGNAKIVADTKAKENSSGNTGNVSANVPQPKAPEDISESRGKDPKRRKNKTESKNKGLTAGKTFSTERGSKEATERENADREKKLKEAKAIALKKSFYAENARFNIVKINTLPLVFGSFAGFYERMVAPGYSVSLGVNYVDFTSNQRYTDQKWFSITPEMRFYAKKAKKADLNGYYVAAYLKYLHVTRPDSVSGSELSHIELNAYGAGLIMGRQFLLDNHFVVDAFVGMTFFPFRHVSSAAGPVQNERIASDYSNDFRIGLAIGYNF
ncbi:MAG: DUF3575 domain-containing protein [Bacteroidota bacterium]